MADALLNEVTAILGSRLAIKAADQAHFGGKQVYTNIAPSTSTGAGGSDPLQSAIEKAKGIALGALGGSGSDSSKVAAEVAALRGEVSGLKAEIAKLASLVQALSTGGAAPAAAAKAAPAPAAAEAKDDDFDLFGSEDEEDDEEKKKVVEERLKAYAEKKALKAGPIAKSSVILDVKPWDDETDLKVMEEKVRSIEMEGLVWGGGKLIPVGYGIQKLQIICVIVDDKVSVDDLIETITGFEDQVQSVDIVAFNKI